MTNPSTRRRDMPLDELLKLSDKLLQQTEAFQQDEAVRSREFMKLIEQNDGVMREARATLKTSSRHRE